MQTMNNDLWPTDILETEPLAPATLRSGRIAAAAIQRAQV